MARQAKELVKEKGVLAIPDLKCGHALTEQTVHLVQSFYQSDDISRVMPGRKDYVSVRVGEGRVHVQKRLVFATFESCTLPSRINTLLIILGFPSSLVYVQSIVS